MDMENLLLYGDNADVNRYWVDKEGGELWMVKLYIHLNFKPLVSWSKAKPELDFRIYQFFVFSLGVIGRFSTADDGIELDIPVGSPWWVPTEGEPSVWFEKMLPTLKEYLWGGIFCIDNCLVTLDFKIEKLSI